MYEYLVIGKIHLNSNHHSSVNSKIFLDYDIYIVMRTKRAYYNVIALVVNIRRIARIGAGPINIILLCKAKQLSKYNINLVF